MRIALIGGTGDIGEGLALRWGVETDHTIVIGSRDAERAAERAESYAETVESCGGRAEFEGLENVAAADGADVVVLSVPPFHVADTVDAIAGSVTGVLVSPAVGISRDESGFHYRPPPTGSVTELVAEHAPEGVPVVGAFHNLAAGRLTDLDADLGIDVLVVADDEDAKATVSSLAEDIPGIRALDAGPIVNAAEVESVTPLLINVAQRNDGLHDLGVSFE
ncbi:NADPH-dependent F420 reductase [Halomarina oriensis]|uniref:NADPH-dependent F420 reductase n=1 Tax=Halomarina oriensis TaxID=671145 RepID=A0A6B0GMZ9_9EURY|nr:NADPH-dependent F420 reductase [Halomarina oriensis]MWG33505.1 NADPH-dependent F420 reductase [Halomarina oriensis]